MNSILQVLQGPSGKTSANRSLTAVVVIAVVGVWATVSIRKNEIQPVSTEQTALVLGALGIQVAHKRHENNSGSGQKPQ